MSPSRPNDELLKFFRGSEGNDEACESLKFLQDHPSLLHELDRAVTGNDFAGYPEFIDRFAIDRVLGRGATAEVVRARDTRNGTPVALKLVATADAQLAEALQQEAAVLAKLSHPNVVRCVDHGATDEWCWLALELVVGQTLADWIADQQALEQSERDQHKRLQRVMRWLRELAEGLAALHDAGSIHRDIKPANVLIREDDSAILIDFGLSQGVAAESWGARVLAGTIPYMSPEQTLAGLVAIDRTSDVYSLAATMYEALCGSRTVSGTDRSKILLDVAFGKVAAPSRFWRNVPAKIDAIFMMALAKERQQRYENARLLAEDIAAYQADTPLPHATPGYATRARAAVRRHVRWLAACAVLLVGVMVVWAVSSNRATAERRVLLGDMQSLLVEDWVVDSGQFLHRLDRFGTHPEVGNFCREHASDLANTCARRTMEELGFFVGGAAGAAAMLTRAEIAAALDAIIPRSGFRFTTGIYEFLVMGPQAALASLQRDRSRVEGDVLLLELRAVLELEVGDSSAFASTSEELEAKPFANLPLSSLAFRSYRHVRTAASARAAKKLQLPGREESIVAADEWAEMAIKSGLAGPFGATCLGLAAMEGGHFDRAAQRFEALVDHDSSRRGSELYSILARALDRGATSESDLARITPLASAVQASQTQVLSWLARQSLSYGSRHVAVGFAAAAQRPSESDAVAATKLAYGLVYKSFRAGAWQDSRMLGGHLATWLRGDDVVEVRQMVGAGFALAIWSGIYDLRDQFGKVGFDEASGRALMQATREHIEVAIARGFGSNLDAAAARAISYLYESRCTSDAEQRARLLSVGKKAARALLENPTVAAVAANDAAVRKTLAFVSQVLSDAE